MIIKYNIINNFICSCMIESRWLFSDYIVKNYNCDYYEHLQLLYKYNDCTLCYLRFIRDIRYIENYPNLNILI